LSKPSVLFLHGAGGGGWEWNRWCGVFKAHGFHVHALDLMPSASGLSETSLEHYSQQVRYHLEGMPSSSPKVMVAASLGGLLALMNSQHADVLLLINPMPPAPFNTQMPTREKYPAIIPWRANANLQGTRRALFDCDDVTCLYAFHHWRDESGLVMNTAMAGVDVDVPSCAVLIMTSENDQEVPFSLSKTLSENMNASFMKLPNTSHVGPLLGRNAAQFALQAVASLNTIVD
jgi:pimeloyl-ACP methyl ester carboxylesterase